MWTALVFAEFMEMRGLSISTWLLFTLLESSFMVSASWLPENLKKPSWDAIFSINLS